MNSRTYDLKTVFIKLSPPATAIFIGDGDSALLLQLKEGVELVWAGVWLLGVGVWLIGVGL